MNNDHFAIIPFERKETWDELVKTFPQHDIYYLTGYVDAFRLHGDGEPILIHYKNGHVQGICVYMKRDIANEPWAAGLEKNACFDLITPYGYGGFIFKGEPSATDIKTFYSEYCIYMSDSNILAAFTRWHPMLNNAELLKGVSNVIDLGKTIHIDTTTEELIMQNILSKDRCTIRKATKNGIEIHCSEDWGIFPKFIDIYNKTMEKDNAHAYYYFEEAFYRSVVENLKGKFKVFYAVYNEEIIAASIILFCNGQVHYHLSGSVSEYRNLNPSNLLLYEVAVWASHNGYKSFHLGGGIGSQQDLLFKFKQSFNKNSGNQFSISKEIFSREAYDKLVELRRVNDKSFNAESSFFPLYRS